MYANGPKIVTDGLVLCLDAGNPKSYSGSGTAWTDISRNGTNGTLTNGPTFNSANGGAIVFDGVDDHVLFSAVNSNYFSVQFWANWNSFAVGNQGNAVISNSQGSTTNGYLIYQGTTSPYNRISFFVRTASGTVVVQSAPTISTSVWYNISTVYNGATVAIYINGAFENSSSQTGTMTSNAGNLVIGKTGYHNSFFNGRVSSALFYNRALSAEQIRQNYNATKGRFKL